MGGNQQNLGHEGVLTTFYSYGSVAIHRQGEIIRNLAMLEGRIEPIVELIVSLAQQLIRAGMAIDHAKIFSK